MKTISINWGWTGEPIEQQLKNNGIVLPKKLINKIEKTNECATFLYFHGYITERKIANIRNKLSKLIEETINEK